MLFRFFLFILCAIFSSIGPHNSGREVAVELNKGWKKQRKSEPAAKIICKVKVSFSKATFTQLLYPRTSSGLSHNRNKKNSRKKRTKVFLFRTILSILSFAATIKYHQWSCNRFLTLQQNNATFTNISFNSTILSAVSLTEFKTIEIKILLWIKLAMVIVWATNARSGNYFKSRSVHYE